MGRVRAVVADGKGGAHLWLEIIDRECLDYFSPSIDLRIGDIIVQSFGSDPECRLAIRSKA